MKTETLQTKTNAVGILATKGTLSSALFSKTSNLFASNITIVEQVGDGIVELIENGKLYSEEMKTLFGDLPEAIENVARIVEKVEPYTLAREVLLPKFDIPEEFQVSEDETDGGKRGENKYLKHLTYEGAKRLYPEITPEITERLDFELNVIREMGFPGYFLIVQDFIAEARRMKVIVGPGRGSAAGSAVAYCTGITNIDPIGYNLLFERFLNPERITMPDIDIDFCIEGREHVINYVKDKYGHDAVCQIITFGTMLAKGVIKDSPRNSQVQASLGVARNTSLPALGCCAQRKLGSTWVLRSISLPALSYILTS